MDDTTADPVKNAAGVVFAAVNKQGESIFEHASGTAGLGISAPMTPEHSFWIASCTKMITGIACMQLVERGVLALDDVELVERLCPVSFCMADPVVLGWEITHVQDFLTILYRDVK